MLGGAAAAAVAAPVVALLPKPAPLLNGQLGCYEGYKVTHTGWSRRTWMSNHMKLQNLPRYGGTLTENVVQGMAAPAMEFRDDTDTGWYHDEDGSIHFCVAGRKFV